MKINKHGLGFFMRASGAGVMRAAGNAGGLKAGAYRFNRPQAQQLLRAYKKGGLLYGVNYQYLAQCWDKTADKAVPKGNVVALKMDTRAGTAEITLTGDKTFFYVQIELIQVGPNQTEANAYGEDVLGSTYMPKWLDTLAKCTEGS